MKDSPLMPCADWAERLAVRYPDDLNYTDRLTLKKHLATCSACASVYAAYQHIGVSLRNMPAVQPLAHLPIELLQREEHPPISPRFRQNPLQWHPVGLKLLGERNFFRSLSLPLLALYYLLQNMPLKLAVVMQTLPVGLKKLAHLLCGIVANFPRPMVCRSADHSYCYLLADGGNSMLWTYKKSQVFFSSPAVAQGILYATAFDTQIFLFASILRLRPTGNSFLWKR